jgi:hypothetical protein
MRFNRFNRWLHHWLSIAIALPIGVVIGTGVLLQLKKDLPWVQPTEHRGSATQPGIAFEDLLAAAAAAVPGEIDTWSDIDRIDVRPGRGLAKLTTHARTEVQIDLADGRVLQVAYRRSDLLESLHDGSWFHPQVKYWLFVVPYWRRWQRGIEP